jgi:hypothetical protein
VSSVQIQLRTLQLRSVISDALFLRISHTNSGPLHHLSRCNIHSCVSLSDSRRSASTLIPAPYITFRDVTSTAAYLYPILGAALPIASITLVAEFTFDQLLLQCIDRCDWYYESNIQDDGWFADGSASNARVAANTVIACTTDPSLRQRANFIVTKLKT